MSEDLEIALIYNIPTREERRLLGMADYQFRSLTTVAGGKSPYEDQENPPEFKLRLAAARNTHNGQQSWIQRLSWNTQEPYIAVQEGCTGCSSICQKPHQPLKVRRA